MHDARVVDTAVPIGIVVRLEVEPQRLLVRAEVSPRDVVQRQVGVHRHLMMHRFTAVVDEHLGDLRIHGVGAVVTHVDRFRVEELADRVAPPSVGQHIDRLDGRGAVLRPFDVHLHREVGRRLEGERRHVQPFDVAVEDRRGLGVYPQNLRHCDVDVRGCLVVIVRNAVVVMIPITGWFCDPSWVSLGIQSFTNPTFLEYIKIQLLPSIIVVIVVERVRTGRRVHRIAESLTVAVVVVVPRVGRVVTEAGRPEHNLVLVLHPILVVVEVLVIADAVIVVVPR